jgi:hypothetical protein
MENLLRSKEYWNLIENGVTVAPANPTAEQLRIANQSKLRDLKVKNYLFQSIDRAILETILVRDSAKDIWDAMKRKYQGSTKVKRAQLQALRREFEILTMKDSETVDEYFSRTLAIANRMTAHGERMEQVTVVEKILRSMPSKFNYVVCSIEESNDVTTLSIDELQSSLIVHEQRMIGQKESNEEQALKISNAGRGSGRGRGRSSTRGRGRGKQSKEHMLNVSSVTNWDTIRMNARVGKTMPTMLSLVKKKRLFLWQRLIKVMKFKKKHGTWILDAVIT